MLKKRFLLLFFLLSTRLWSYDYLLSDGEKIYFVDVAQTSAQRQRGLMYRFYVPSFYAMLFVFEQEQKLSFWMKNTPSRLDIRFYDKNGALINTAKNVPPCLQKNCPIYSSEKKALFVLEVRGKSASTGKNLLYIKPLKK